MPCPYFYPVARLEEDLWAVPPRLPLGDAYRGECRAAGVAQQPDDASIRGACNSGYARGKCDRFPEEAPADAVRFNVASDDDDGIRVQFILEKACWPLDHGELRYSVREGSFEPNAMDEILGRQAAAFVESYLRRAR